MSAARQATSSVGRGTNQKEVKSGGGEWVGEGIIGEMRERDKKPEGRGVEAQLGLSELDSKQETLMLNDG